MITLNKWWKTWWKTADIPCVDEDSAKTIAQAAWKKGHREGFTAGRGVGHRTGFQEGTEYAQCVNDEVPG